MASSGLGLIGASGVGLPKSGIKQVHVVAMIDGVCDMKTVRGRMVGVHLHCGDAVDRIQQSMGFLLRNCTTRINRSVQSKFTVKIFYMVLKCAHM